MESANPDTEETLNKTETSTDVKVDHLVGVKDSMQLVWIVVAA